MNGCDISEHQAAFPDGAWDFVVIRVGTGEVPRADLRWFDHAQEARRLGIPAGAYWFADPSKSSPEAQADLFVSLLAARPGGWELIPWCDLEIGNITRDWEQRFNATVEAAVGAAGTYASESVFQGALAGSPWHRWIANWSHEPAQPWDVWQTSGSPLDLDYAPSLAPISLHPAPPAPPIPPDQEEEPMTVIEDSDGNLHLFVIARDSSVATKVTNAKTGAVVRDWTNIGGIVGSPKPAQP